MVAYKALSTLLGPTDFAGVILQPWNCLKLLKLLLFAGLPVKLWPPSSKFKLIKICLALVLLKTSHSTLTVPHLNWTTPASLQMPPSARCKHYNIPSLLFLMCVCVCVIDESILWKKKALTKPCCPQYTAPATISANTHTMSDCAACAV